jgi:hypothetical protein
MRKNMQKCNEGGRHRESMRGEGKRNRERKK